MSLPPAPPRFTLESFPANGHFQFQLTGQTGAGYTIQTSSNLVAWAALGTAYLTNGSATEIDLQSTNFPRRYYRAVWLP